MLNDSDSFEGWDALTKEIEEHIKYGHWTNHIHEGDLDVPGDDGLTLRDCLQGIADRTGAEITEGVDVYHWVSVGPSVLMKPRDTSKWPKVVQVWARDGNHCQRCGNEVMPYKIARALPGRVPYAKVGVIDHKVRRADGGKSNIENLRLLCWTCNASIAAWSDR